MAVGGEIRSHPFFKFHYNPGEKDKVNEFCVNNKSLFELPEIGEEVLICLDGNEDAVKVRVVEIERVSTVKVMNDEISIKFEVEKNSKARFQSILLCLGGKCKVIVQSASSLSSSSSSSTLLIEGSWRFVLNKQPAFAAGNFLATGYKLFRVKAKNLNVDSAAFVLSLPDGSAITSSPDFQENAFPSRHLLPLTLSGLRKTHPLYDCAKAHLKNSFKKTVKVKDTYVVTDAICVNQMNNGCIELFGSATPLAGWKMTRLYDVIQKNLNVDGSEDIALLNQVVPSMDNEVVTGTEEEAFQQMVTKTARKYDKVWKHDPDEAQYYLKYLEDRLKGSDNRKIKLLDQDIIANPPVLGSQARVHQPNQVIRFESNKRKKEG